MKHVKGDLIKMALNGDFDVIVQGCNCFCTMRSGIALQIKNTWPGAEKADSETAKGDRGKLGGFTVYSEESDSDFGKFCVINAYTQYNYGMGKVNADYSAIRSAFREIKACFSGARIGYPAIGAGLARGDWGIISKIIDEELEGEDHTFVEYHL